MRDSPAIVPLQPLSVRIIRNYFRMAHSLVRRRWRQALGATALFGLVLAGVYLAAIQLVLYLVHIREQQSILLRIVTLPFSAYALGALLQFFTRLVRAPDATGFRDLLLKSPRRYLHLALCLAYYYALYVLLLRVVIDIERYEGIIQIRMIAGAGLFVWLLARLAFAPLYIVDQDQDVRTAIRNSYLLTTRRTRRTLALVLVSLLVLWLGVLALGIGAVYTLALVLCVAVLLFDNYRNAPAARQRLLRIEGVAQSPVSAASPGSPATKSRY
jgi:hypothetical protein